MTKPQKSVVRIKTANPKLRCFVAMAFGHKDLDSVYENHMAKAIESANMTPIRIDRVVHLDRIDAKIREEIAKADVMVADLTYARPSVYWEAGFAERAIPVVYTCRLDHFKPKPDDEQVHFDLKNANIIAWSESEGSAFEKRFLKTLLYAVQPLRKNKKEQEQREAQRLDFSLKSQAEKTNLVLNSSLSRFSELGYKSSPIESRPVGNFLAPGVIFGRRTFSKQIGEILILLTEPTTVNTISERTFRMLVNSLGGLWDLDRFVTTQEIAIFPKSAIRRKTRIVRRIVVVSSVGTIPEARILKVLPYWHKTGTFLHFCSTKIGTPWRNRISMPSSSELVVIEKIKSIPEYEDSIDQILRHMEGVSSTIILPGS
jgi:nucleoside 2-deoxyribosyltransferase